jgi:hypothetical protein
MDNLNLATFAEGLGNQGYCQANSVVTWIAIALRIGQGYNQGLRG